MHLPDGIVDEVPLLAGAALLSAGVVARCVARLPRESGRDRLAWTGTLAAFALALQAINVPALPGASAHAIGASLLTLVLGPAAAVAALFAVVLVQALFFADGGVAALGINTIHIVLLPVLCVTVFRRLLPRTARGLSATAVLGSVFGNLLAATSLATMLVIVAKAPAAVTYGTLVGIQVLAGLVEGILTATAVSQLHRRAPRLLHGAQTKAAAPGRTTWAWAAVLVGATLMAIPLASTAPDALELVLSRAHAAP